MTSTEPSLALLFLDVYKVNVPVAVLYQYEHTSIRYFPKKSLPSTEAKLGLKAKIVNSLFLVYCNIRSFAILRDMLLETSHNL